MAENADLERRLDAWRRELHRMSETVNELEGYIAAMAELIDDEDGDREIDMTGWVLSVEDQAGRMASSIDRLKRHADRIGHEAHLSELRVEAEA